MLLIQSTQWMEYQEFLKYQNALMPDKNPNAQQTHMTEGLWNPKRMEHPLLKRRTTMLAIRQIELPDNMQGENLWLFRKPDTSNHSACPS